MILNTITIWKRRGTYNYIAAKRPHFYTASYILYIILYVSQDIESPEQASDQQESKDDEVTMKVTQSYENVSNPDRLCNETGVSPNVVYANVAGDQKPSVITKKKNQVYGLG